MPPQAQKPESTDWDPDRHRSGQTTSILVARARAGDSTAVDALFERHRTSLTHWAHGRLPLGARDLKDTQDLVQEAMHRAFRRVETFEARRPGSFLAYLCQILTNLIRDEVRRHRNRPKQEELSESIEDRGPTPIEVAIGSDTFRRYQCALQRLPEDQRQAVVLRVELGLSYAEIGEELQRPTANAARLLVSRGLERLSREMNEEHR